MTDFTRIQLRRDTAANWATNNPTLALGEMGIETDTRKFKFGDGSTEWTSLDYASTGGNIPTKLSDLENDEGFITLEDVEEATFVKEEEIRPIEHALEKDTQMIPSTKEKGIINLGKNGTDTKVTVTANNNYYVYTYKVYPGQQLTIQTIWNSVTSPFGIWAFTKDDKTIITKRLQAAEGGTQETEIVNDKVTVPENATTLYVAACWIYCYGIPKVYLGDAPEPYEEPYTEEAFTPTETLDSYFTLKSGSTYAQPTKAATSTLYRTLKFDVSTFVGKEIRIRTYWSSGALNIPLYAFASSGNLVRYSRYYRSYASEINTPVFVDDIVKVPPDSTTLYVAVRPEDLEHPEVECKAGSITRTDASYINVGELSNSVTSIQNNITDILKGQKIKLAFIGNSLTQDAVSYVPWILTRLAPNVDFDIWMWYNGGYTLAQQYADWSTNKKAQIVSHWKKGDTKWTNYKSGTAMTMQQFLANGPFDVVSLQEYFNYKTTYGETDLNDYRNCLNYIRDNLSSPFYLANMIHLPHQDQDKEGYGDIDMDERFKFLIDSTKIMWNNLPIQSNIPAGYAWYHVKDTVCSSLGDVGNLCADYTHAQEGLGCQMLGWVTALWILRHIGYPTGVLNDPLQISTAIYQSFDVPGPNLGTGVVIGSTEQYRAAQQLAANAFKECDAIFGTQKSKTSDLDNDAGFVKEQVSKEGFDIVQVIGARKYEYTSRVTGNLMPWTIFGGAKLANQRLYSIGYESDSAEEHVFGYIPSSSAWGIDTNRTSYSLFKVNAEIGYHTYLLDGTDSRVTILTDNIVDGFPVMPDESTFCIVSGAGIRTSQTQDIRAKDQDLIYLNGSNVITYSAFETSLDIKVALPTNSTEKVVKAEKEIGEYQNYKSKRPASVNPNDFTTVSAGSSPYVYYNNEDIQDCDLVSIGMGCLTTGATVKFWIGQCNGATADFIDYSVPLIPAFDITLANTDYTEYKLDGTDSNVVIYDGALVDGKVHVGKTQILCFCELNATNQFAYVSRGKNDEKAKIVEEDQWFCGTNNWSSLTAVSKSAMNIGITINKKKKVVDQLNPLKGKRVSIIGDSISTYAGYIPEGYAIAYPKWDVSSPDDCWWMKVIKKGDMVLGQNCAWSGSKVCGVATGNSAEAACSDQRIKDLALNGTPDIVVCFIGTNDVGNTATMGEWHKGDAIPANSGTVSTMSEAYALMVSKIMKTYPLARVYCCSLPERKRVSGEKITEYPMVSNGLTLYDFNDMVKEVCEALGAVYVDLHGCGMTWWNAETYLVWEEKGVLHPNKLGMELFAKCVYSAIANDYEINRGE